ncbi:hypothetical protein [Clostridium tertium]|uniref:Uncharacterized protein n=1 Tax=Clostridium tertium TaxID=1559 RepID=A0A6N3DK72_9CLOT
MEMNEILNGLNSCGGSDNISSQCPPQSGPFSGGGCGGFGGFGGFSWIWILLILFYCGGFGGFGGRSSNRGCCKPVKCCCKRERKECCCPVDSGYGNTGFGGCSNWLFLLVILFLCNGCSGFGNCGNGNLFGGFC